MLRRRVVTQRVYPIPGWKRLINLTYTRQYPGYILLCLYKDSEILSVFCLSPTNLEISMSIPISEVTSYFGNFMRCIHNSQDIYLRLYLHSKVPFFLFLL